MIERKILVENRLGLHARAAAKLVQVTSQFRSEIHVCREGERQEIDCKSILGILMLGAGRGTRLILTFCGDDETEAANAVTGLFTNKFGEQS